MSGILEPYPFLERRVQLPEPFFGYGRRGVEIVPALRDDHGHFEFFDFLVKELKTPPTLSFYASMGRERKQSGTAKPRI